MPQNPQISRRVYPGTLFWRGRQISGRAISRLHVRRGGFQVLACCVPPLDPALGRAWLTFRGGLPIQANIDGVRAVISTHPKNPAARMFDHALSLEHDLLHHCLHAPPLCRMAQFRIFANERVLANQAQDAKQAEERLQNVAVGNTVDIYLKSTFNASAAIQSRHILPHWRQSSIRSRVLEQPINNKVGHVLAHI